jgi:hypothetical protein
MNEATTGGLLPGQVHWIQARKALEDQEGTRTATLIKVGDSTVTVRFADGHIKDFDLPRAPEVAAALERALPVDEGYGVLVSERWRVLGVPVGRTGPPPRRVEVLTGVAKLVDGAAVEAFSAGDSHSILLFAIRASQ